MIAAGHMPRPSWYNARATVISRLLVLEAEKLAKIISQPGFEVFRRYIIRYGVWSSFKLNFVKAMKSGALETILDKWRDHDPHQRAPPLERARDLEDRVADRVLDKLATRLDALEAALLSRRRDDDDARGEAAPSNDA